MCGSNCDMLSEGFFFVDIDQGGRPSSDLLVRSLNSSAGTVAKCGTLSRRNAVQKSMNLSKLRDHGNLSWSIAKASLSNFAGCRTVWLACLIMLNFDIHHLPMKIITNSRSDMNFQRAMRGRLLGLANHALPTQLLGPLPNSFTQFYSPSSKSHYRYHLLHPIHFLALRSSIILPVL